MTQDKELGNLYKDSVALLSRMELIESERQVITVKLHKEGLL